jgi:type II secretory pathway component PulC
MIQGGQLRGFTAFGVQPGSLFYRIGLRQQDVILAVNGEQEFTPADIYAAMQSAGVVEFLVQSPSRVQRALVFELVEK